MERVVSLASQRAVVIFTLSSCCMCHAVKRLFEELGADPEVHELDDDPSRREMEIALIKMLGREPAVPTVFIGGNMVGATDAVLTLHLSGRLVPMLREVGALQPQQINGVHNA